MATIIIERKNVTDEERKEVFRQAGYIAALMIQDIKEKSCREEQVKEEA